MRSTYNRYSGPRWACALGCERIGVHLDSGLAPADINRHDVEAARTTGNPPAYEKLLGHPRNPLLLLPRDGRAIASERVSRPRFHLDEHERLTRLRDDVNFSIPAAIAAFENCVPATYQFAAGECFPDFPKRLAAAA